MILKTCPACQEKVGTNADECLYCGYLFDSTSPPKTPIKPQIEKRKMWKLAIAGFVVLGLGIWGFF